MYQVLLVDDELVALRTIQWILPWETLQVSRVMTAANAEEAKQQLQKYQIDLVICDVEMPGMDGLSFARWASEAYPDTAFIMLTCHQDFSFVQQSLRTGCLDYILKPATAEILSDSVKRALEHIEKRRRSETGKAARESAERERQKQLYYELLREIVENPNADVKNVAKEFGLNFLNSMQCRPVLVQIRKWLEQFDDEDDLLLRYGVYNAAQDELLDQENGGTALRINRDQILLVLYDPYNMDVGDVYERCTKLVDRCGAYLNCEISCYIGRVTGMEYLGENYRELQERSLKYAASGTVYAVEWSDTWTDLHDWCAYQSEWLEMMSQQQYSALLDQIRETLILLDGENTLDKACLIALHRGLLDTVREHLAQHQLQMDALGETEQDVSWTCSSAEKLLHWASELLRRVQAMMEAIYQEDELIRRIRDFITVHINEDINRESIASAVYLTPDYLSRIFKKRTGMGLTKYIVNRRIELACQLLTQTNMSVNNIATELGYSSFSHFSKIFKQQMGKTPGAYRRDKGQK